MKKIAIFVEGQTERIFLVKFLSEYLGVHKIEIRMEKNLGKKGIKFVGMRRNPYADYFFLVYDISGDGNVVSALKERAEHMIKNAGYTAILALRDLYPLLREEKGKVAAAFKKMFMGYSFSDRVKLVLAVMEIEAWFLGDYRLFERLRPGLTAEYIKQRLGIDLVGDDPESYHHPSEKMNDIFKLFDDKYRKREKQAHRIAENLDYNYLICSDEVLGKLSSFYYFIHCLEQSLES